MASGTIAYCSREDHAPPQFAACLARLAQRHPDAAVKHYIGNDIAESRNLAVMKAEGEWLWFIDTDMLFAPETLDRLLAWNVAVVQALCLMRWPPHEPILWTRNDTDRDKVPVGEPRLVEVKTLGAGGTLYRRRVFESMSGPWFEGILGMEDTNFARKIALVGIPMYCDLTTPVRHLTHTQVYPKYHTGAWHICYESVDGQTIEIPYDQSRLVAVPVGSR